ncbi:uncharacterized protein [Rutidosis leptorrhynchoides]|uniref:uncharacterized protein n=1 Tax=Rutidosis leptorrhynchoides TaxID=125765 RepID=UPI003A9A0059
MRLLVKNLKDQSVKIKMIDPYASPEIPVVMRTDPGEFQIPCLIRCPIPVIGLADTGSSINVMPFSVYNRLGLPSLEPIKGNVCFADSRLHEPLGVVKEVEVIVRCAFYRIDFVVMDMKEDLITPSIIGSPFLATARALTMPIIL